MALAPGADGGNVQVVLENAKNGNPTRPLVVGLSDVRRAPSPVRALAVASVLLLGAGFASADGGGNVTNALPTTVSFGNALGAATTVFASDTFSGTVDDDNGEVDLTQISLATTSGPAVTATRTIAAADLAQATKPASATSGWKVWNPTSGDGLLSFRVEVAYPATPGVYVFRASVKDEGVYQNGPATDVQVELFLRIVVAGDPVAADGTPQEGANWGAWTTDPGATNVAATNYLKVTNSGILATQAFVVDFTPDAFAGVTDATSTIGIDNNLRFAWWEDTTPGTTSPAEGADAWSTWLDPTATGSTTATFTGRGNIIYVSYRIEAIPDPVPDQNYSASYTVDPV